MTRVDPRLQYAVESQTSLLSVLVLVANTISDTNNKNCVPCRFVGWVERSDTHQRKYAL